MSDRQLLVLGAAVAVLVTFAWRLRIRILSGRPVISLVITLLVLTGLRESYDLGRFLRNPSYRSNEIAAAVERLVPAEASIAGAWAPFLFLGTGLRTLYSSSAYNYPSTSRFDYLRPDYFLFSDSQEGRLALENLGPENPDLELGEPIFESSYVGRAVVLYPIRYLRDG